jgi:ribosome-binding factor A
MSLRTDRVASVIKEEVGTLLSREYSDPAYGLITVTDVHVSPDIRIAKIYVSIMGTEEVRALTLRMLEERKGEIRSFIGSHLRLKFTPSIQLYLDETMERVDRLEQLLRKIHRDDEQRGKG